MKKDREDLIAREDGLFEMIMPSGDREEIRRRVQEAFVGQGKLPPTSCWIVEACDGIFPYLGAAREQRKLLRGQHLLDGWYWIRQDDGKSDGPYLTADEAREAAYQAHKCPILVDICSERGGRK